jgi:zinc transporter ZupT
MSDGLNTILLVTHGEPARRRDVVFLAMDAIAPVLGGLLALAVLPPPTALAIFLGFASGFFLYTATSDLLPEAHRRSTELNPHRPACAAAAAAGLFASTSCLRGWKRVCGFDEMKWTITH